MKIHKENFYLGTTGNFKKAKKPKREPDFVSFTGRKRFLKDEEIFDGDLDVDFYFSLPDDEETAYSISGIYDVKGYDEKINFLFDIDGDYWKVIEYKEEGILIQMMEKISSEYWYSKKGVYRKSNHWGNVADNYWSFEGKEVDDIELIGFCKWQDFDKSSCNV